STSARAQISGKRTLTAAATSARSSPCWKRSARMTAGSPASAATSRRAARRLRSCSGRTVTASGSFTRSRTGTRSAFGPTSRSTRFRTTRCTSPATARSAASPVPGRPRPTRRSVPAAGPAPTNWNAVSTSKPNRRHMNNHIYAVEHPETTHVRDGGFTLWFTGLSGSGKTTIAHLVGPELDRRGLVVEYLDGDNVRMHLSKGLGFSKEDRDTHIERVGWVASRLTRQGGAVITAAISPYEETRRKARAMVEEWGAFVEVYVAASVEECARRDVKGLYEKAFRGEIKGFTGVDDPYETPSDPELVLDTEAHDPEESAQLVLAKLEELGLVPTT